MSNLVVKDHNGILVVDSRLVAAELGIQHKNFLATIEKYNPQMASAPEMGPATFETRLVKRSQGGTYEERWAWLTERQATFIMTLSRNTKQVVSCKLALSIAFDKAKQILKLVIPAHSPETEQIKLELELIRAKQHYQDTGHAIALSTSPVMLQWLRGETPSPPKIEYRDRFIDAATGKEIGSSSGRSLTQLISDTGLNPKSTHDRQLVKKILRCHGFDYDKMQHWSTASYLREYPVLEGEAYQQALRAVLAEVVEGDQEPNLFVHQMQQAILTPGTQPHSLEGVEP